MKFVIFGLTVSSSWGNGHATLWRGLIRALARQGHSVAFFERDVPYYAANRDLRSLSDGAALVLYPDWESIRPAAAAALADADVAMVTSYCPDGIAAAALIFDKAPGVAIFYDLDTPVTLARLSAGEALPYLPPQGLGEFDLVLSYTGGQALDALRDRLGARRVAPLYGHVDPDQHRPAAPMQAFRADLSYLGTFAADRQAALEILFIEPARLRPGCRFVLGGSGYPQDFPWTDNIYFVKHLPPPDHPAFFSSSRLTLNVTRSDMATMGYCPSGRLFEAAACGTPILSDWWEGLDAFFEPRAEILIGRSAEDAIAALDLSDEEMARIAKAARDHVLGAHSSAHRARQLVELIRDIGALAPAIAPTMGPTTEPTMGLGARLATGG
ncbi:glycosyltransferase [Sphingomonas oleivorans]|uniref:Glycosyltransferase n=1 Tax=Sphingomonas oleivorans TaxID=1735121 RepID=A0A2T5G243_9SPHN|nr:glycosyltransferase [Sphingomonas oleivorans]PTQ13214.1 glycosyltransferase [Sphingomonas oleivorans]